MRTSLIIVVTIFMVLPGCRQKPAPVPNQVEFASEMVEFVPFDHNPLFSGTGTETWDKVIRERGFIIAEEGIFKMWYTGYSGKEGDLKILGYATSDDGISWARHPGNPIFKDKWTEDMFVMKHEGKYFMYAEGVDDVAHLLISDDGIKWEEQGDLTIRTVKGDSIPGPYGTPAVFIEDGKWYLFYERNDSAIWLATSDDQKIWKNIQDEPVLKKGPEEYDAGAVAANQVVKRNGKYYIYYHGSNDPDWNKPGSGSLWTSNVAVSSDLINWVKYPGNPIVEGDHSSPILVPDGDKFRLYTMHDKVWLYLPK
jgi:beta-1,2-mannobiose phosphorylase / 1,2-beta-oligomannan phosphorylase